MKTTTKLYLVRK